MSLKRYNIDLAFPEPISTSLASKLMGFENAVKAILLNAVKINEGKVNEEATRAVWHKCHHDIGEACEEERDI